MTTPVSARPVVGAAMRLDDLPTYIDWLVADQRDLEVQDPSYMNYLDEEWLSQVRAGRTLLDTNGYRGRLGIHGVYDGVDLATHDKRLRAVIGERLTQSLAFGAELGATHMVIHSPFYFFGNAFANHTRNFGRPFMIEAVRAALEPILPIAERMGCTLVFETIFDTNPAPLVELVRAFDSPLVRLSIDAGHAFIMQQHGGTPPDQWVYEAGELLGHLHLQDTDGQSDRHWAIGDGSIPWHALFAALATLDHQPRLIMEVEAINRSFRWLVEHELAR